MIKICGLIAGMVFISAQLMSQVSGFEKNIGQIANSKGELQNDVIFKSKSGNAQIYFYPDCVTYFFKKKSDRSHFRNFDIEKASLAEIEAIRKLDTTYIHRVELKFLESNTRSVDGVDKKKHYANYFLAHCPNGIDHVPFFEAIVYKDVYPGIDIRFKNSSKGIKYDIHVKAGADLSDIKLQYSGQDYINLEDNVLHLGSQLGELSEELPASYVIGDIANPFASSSDASFSSSEKINLNYTLVDGVISFRTNGETNQSILIDPVLAWSTYYDYDDDSFYGHEMDAANGQVVNVGSTSDATMPVWSPGGTAYMQFTPNQPTGTEPDLRILQFDTDGELLWATYYGGELQEFMRGGVEINPATGDIYIAAVSASLNFPTMNFGGGAWFESTNVSGETQIVLMRFQSDGTRRWSTYFNANLAAIAHDIALSPAGDLYVVGDNGTGYTIPTQTLLGAYNQALPSPNSATDKDAIILSFSPTCVFQWGTYFGLDNAGPPTDVEESFSKVDIASDGSIYCVGTVNENTTILSDAGGYYDNTHNGNSDVLIARFSAAGALEWSSYFGGSGDEVEIYGLDIDSDDNVYISGLTSSSDLPTMDPGNGAYFDNTLNGTQSGFITKFNSSTDLIWSTYFGSAADDWRTMIDVSPNDKIYLAQYTSGTSGMPTMQKTNAYYEAAGVASLNGFIAQFDTSGTQEWGTYVNSLGATEFRSITTYDGVCGDQVYVGGTQDADGFPVVNPGGAAYVQGYSGSGIDKFTISQFNEDFLDPGWTQPTGICENAPLISLNSYLTGDPGGVWSGVGVNGGTDTFDPSLVTDSSEVTYMLGSGACMDSLKFWITIDSMSVIPLSINATLDSVCPGGNSTLTINGGSLGSGADWYWYEGSCGNNFLGTGTTLIVSPANTTTYYARAEGTCGNTGCVAKTVFVKTISTTATGVSNFLDPVCVGDSTYIAPIGGSLGTGASWNYYEGSCGGTFLGTGDSLAVHPTVTTQYFIQASGDCNTTTCQSISVSTAQPSVDPISINASDTVICSGGFANLSVNGGSLGTSADWEWYTGTCGGTPIGNGTNISVSPTSNTSYFVRAEGYCGNTICVQLDMDVHTPSTAPTSITAGSTNICNGDSTTLTVAGGSLGNGAEWYWYTGSCGGTLVDSGTTITVNPTVFTTYFVRAENECNSTACAQVNISITAAGDAAWTDPVSICESAGPTDFDPLITGNTGGTWLSANMAGSFFNPAGLGGQNITVSYTQGSGACQDTVTHTFSVTTVVNASWTNPIDVCATNGTVDLDQFITGTTGGSWNGTGVTGSTFDPSGLTGPIAIEYVVGTAPGCQDSTTQQINVLDGPVAPTVSATDSTICQGDTITLMATGSGAGALYNVYDAATGGNLLGQTNLDVDPASTITYYFQGEDANGCYHVGALVPLTITVTPAPVAVVSNDTTICEGSTISLTASGGDDYLWNTSETTASINVSPSTDSTYSVQVIENVTGCSATETINVTVINPSDVEGMDDAVTVIVEEPTNILVLANDVNADANTLNIIYGPFGGNASVNTNFITYTSNSDYVGNDTLLYSVCHPTCPSFCDTAYVNIFVTFGLDVEVPTGFSPNGDGINDAFVILGLENYPEAELLVFNRWGELVYNVQQYNNNWMGESNGKRTLGGEQVPDGTYFYVLKLGDQFQTVNGYVEIKRQ